MTCQRSWRPCWGCLQTTLQHTEWCTAAQTRSRFNKTSIALWNGRRAGTFYSTLPNVCSCQSPRYRSPLDYSYELHGHTLDSVSSAKYLGITIQQDMDWDNHINNVVNKASRMLGFLWRNQKISSSAIKDRAYKAFVRPILEYASSARDPYTQKSIDKLEAVQRRAAPFVLNRYHNTSSVNLMLDSLGWPSLEQRRKTSRLGVMFKICNGLVQCPIIKTKLVPPPPHHTLRQRRTHCQQLSLITTRTQYRGGSFLPRTIRDWNSLSIDAVEVTTVDTFVSRASHWPVN